MSFLVDKMEDENINLPNLDLNQKLNLKNPEKNIIKNQIIKFDPTKKACQFIITKNNNSIIYGIKCGDICEKSNIRCKKHLNSKKKRV